jgi:hypothetical protein
MTFSLAQRWFGVWKSRHVFYQRQLNYIKLSYTSIIKLNEIKLD